MKKSQLVFVPFPGMGHLMATLEFAKLLITNNEHISITIIVIRAPFDSKVEAYIHSLTPSLSFPTQLCFTLLPPHPDPTNSQALHRATFMDSLIEYQKPNMRDTMFKLNSDLDSPRLAGLVVDMFCTTMIDVANELDIPTLVFYTSGAAFLQFVLHIHTLRDKENLDTTSPDFWDSGLEFEVPGFENYIPASAFPREMAVKEWAVHFFNNASRIKRSKGIIVNTFEELESDAVQSFCNTGLTVYPVGPILSPGDISKKLSEGADDVLQWLDDQPPSSVLFLCFGSKGYFDDVRQVREIARALESSGVHFVWSLRKIPPKINVTEMEVPTHYSDLELEGLLEGGFLERTTKIGRVIGWAPQAQILAHKAVGGFVSHCGWNSILESIYYGVPIATWPLHAEQQFNAFQFVRELKMSVEISLDYRVAYGNESKTRVISAKTIEEGIRQVMEMESEVRKKVKEMSEISKRVLMEGGSSYSYLRRFIDDILD